MRLLSGSFSSHSGTSKAGAELWYPANHLRIDQPHLDRRRVCQVETSEGFGQLPGGGPDGAAGEVVGSAGEEARVSG